MNKKSFTAFVLSAAFAFASASAFGWPLWDDFKEANLSNGRVVDYSDAHRITTSEGQSYGLFFALVANDREAFAKLLDWTENNLCRGDITKRLPVWQWGSLGNQRWGVMDSNNAVDSDMWIAYALLEAGRLWGEPAYTEKGRAMMELIKSEVREVENLGLILLPGRTGFEKDGGVLKTNPSYYPLFLIRRFAEEDPYWNAVYEGSLALLIRSSPSGISPDWALFDKNGRFVAPADEDTELGSYNAIRTYLWAGMLAKDDPSRQLLLRHFQPMVGATREINMPPEKIHVVTLKVNGGGPDGFGACLLPLLGNDKTAALIRTVLSGRTMEKDAYYSNVLTLFGLGFDEGRFAFDAQGRVYFPKNADWTGMRGAAQGAEARKSGEPSAPETAKTPAENEEKAPQPVQKPAEAPAKTEPGAAEPKPTDSAPAPKASQSAQGQHVEGQS